MIKHCMICLGEIEADLDYHSRCLKALFSASVMPEISIEGGMIQAAGLAMAGTSTLSGVQKKISIKLSHDCRRFQVANEGTGYILKPQTGTYPHLPEIEHTTMQLARLYKLETAANGLVRLHDGSLAYLTRRFDRRKDGSKVHQEDFCQLAEQRPGDKYRGSAERCVQIIKKFASEPGIELLKLFRHLLFSWWVGNGDLHLKNLSILIDEARRIKLSPAYDLVSTQLVIPGDKLALPIAGRDQKIRFTTWYRLADFAHVPRPAMRRLMVEQIKLLPKANAMIERSFMPEWYGGELKRIVQDNTATLEQLHGLR